MEIKEDNLLMFGTDLVEGETYFIQFNTQDYIHYISTYKNIYKQLANFTEKYNGIYTYKNETIKTLLVKLHTEIKCTFYTFVNEFNEEISLCYTYKGSLFLDSPLSHFIFFIDYFNDDDNDEVIPNNDYKNINMSINCKIYNIINEYVLK